jgi:hypothetical protein
MRTLSNLDTPGPQKPGRLAMMFELVCLARFGRRVDCGIAVARCGSVAPEASITKGELAKYKNLSPEDRCSFELWLRANSVVGVMFTLALVAFALAGSVQTPAQTISFQELHGKPALNDCSHSLHEGTDARR